MTNTALHALRKDYRRWHHLQTATADLDPVYPVLSHLAHHQGLDTEHTVRLVFTHVAYYHLGSALHAWHTSGGDFTRMPAPAPTGTERRGHRSPTKLRAHLDHLAHLTATEGGLAPWLERTTHGLDPVNAWRAATDHCLMRIHGNGRWASYKTAEMLADVAGLPLAAPDMGHAHSSGPRHGLALLHPRLASAAGNDPTTIATLDAVSARLAASLGAPVEKAETSLCDFHSLVNGSYYLGHDIDQMLGQLHQVPSPLTGPTLDARAATLPHPYLGELHGWDGVDRARKHAYRTTGRILTRGGRP